MDARLVMMVGNVGRRMLTGQATLPSTLRPAFLKHSQLPVQAVGCIPRRFLRLGPVNCNSSAASSNENKAQDAAEPQGTEDNANKRGRESEIEETLRAELDKFVTENATLLSKSRDFEDKYKRALAESENLRTRLTKQINDAKLYAVQGFCKDMTEISDILRMAIDSVPKDQLNNDNPHLKNLYDGLSMTDSRLMQVFKSHGLTQINPLDEKFNPNEHEAVVHQPVEGKESGTVIFVSKMGYKLHDRVIRPAVVGVAK